MNILQPISTEQTLIFIPRYNAQNIVLNITDEQTETGTELELTATYLDGYMYANISYDFIEGGRYSYEVRDTENELMYRGKIFVTAQTDLQEYKVNPDILIAD
ncbi:hypothetical protein [Maribacter sp. 2210JD10-5]|uniref:hypothetical protein n=1 Tax=Maribacter sp. 2210JD10-5 TaxID=3386272 RepID=UPI0039BC97B8